MNAATVIVLLVILLLAMLAVRRIRRKKLLFSCGGDCSRCAGKCPHAKKE
ncbi:MAG: FeoB-associated Cys-rich membrane protein [Clostridia bacterium]|nr:FeoB-associated Cys-rich membrane protein [Clostridia bacterium]